MLGLTIPLEFPLHEHLGALPALRAAGYTDYWTGESSGADGFSPLLLAAGVVPQSRLGTAIVPVFTRGLGLLAMSAAALADATVAPTVVGLGASTPTIVESWNGAEYGRPLARMRGTVEFLRQSLHGERVSGNFGGLTIRGFRLERIPRNPPAIFVAALRPKMLGLAGEIADGVILNWISARDVTVLAPLTGRVPGPAGHFDVMARIFVCPTTDRAKFLQHGRALIARYLTVPAYARLHRWLGRERQLRSMWDAWERGDRTAAGRAVPEDVVDELIIGGTAEACAVGIQRYLSAGVTIPVVRVLPIPAEYDTVDAAIGLAQAFQRPAGH